MLLIGWREQARYVIKKYPHVTEQWNTETYVALTTAEMERLQIILDKKLYELTTEFENRLFLRTRKKDNTKSSRKVIVWR